WIGCRKVKSRTTGSRCIAWVKAFGKFGYGMQQVAYRIMYVAKFADAVYVLHYFQKKTQKTRKADMDLAGQRYRDLLKEMKS
ncbi:type II toxin-antitoxin system RelE/ParE family toxin, partial [Acidithiobacillus ferridurans]